MPRHKGSPASGFTLIEMLAVLALASILMAIGVPLLNNFIQRSHLEGFARESSLLIQAARFNAIKKSSTQSVVRLDVANHQLVSFEDKDNDGIYDTTKGDVELARRTLPAGVLFWGPPDSVPNGTNITNGLSPDPGGGTPHVAILRPDGSIQDAGAFCLGDRHGNYLEVLIKPEGTARVQILKWDGAAWREQGYNNQAWTWN
jgi:prepilin-type N-terminal cleavage/methylation domain-containing protein